MMTENNVVAMDVAAMRVTMERLRQLHAPISVCRGCCATSCDGQCDWADEYSGELLTVCSHCCIDDYEQKQNEPCLDEHYHGAEHGAARQICATNTLLGVEPPAPTVTREGPPMAVRTTLRLL
ncbi:MAG: hypothetical protein O3B27_05325 [Actinomycetota bacterium]|nr:hypothetical protein [Actinomycetota bacterium]MDA2949502.1 hypothetical protein [Actinomycetota bacterium]MDA2990962.1 hypothetical protein [Actinomycetota bacterium]